MHSGFCSAAVVLGVFLLAACGPSAEEVAAEILKKQEEQRKAGREYAALLCEKKGHAAKELYNDARSGMSESEASAKYLDYQEGLGYAGLVASFYRSDIYENISVFSDDLAAKLADGYGTVIKKQCLESTADVIRQM